MGSVPWQAGHRMALVPLHEPALILPLCALMELAPENERQPVLISKELGTHTVPMSQTTVSSTTFPFLYSKGKRKK